MLRHKALNLKMLFASTLPLGLALAGSVLLWACEDAADNTAATTTIPGDTTSASDTATADSSASDTKASDAKADVVKPPCKPWDLPVDWNCPADTHCGYDESDKIACVANGEHAVGEDCADGKGCKIGMCVTSQNGKSACAPYCTSVAHCESSGCNKIVDKIYSVCDMAKYEPCSPLAPKCEAKQGCYLVSGGFGCATAGSTPAGEVCTQNTDCLPGLHCAGAAGGAKGYCRKICSLTAPTGCDDVTTACSKLSSSAGYCEY